MRLFEANSCTIINQTSTGNSFLPEFICNVFVKDNIFACTCYNNTNMRLNKLDYIENDFFFVSLEIKCQTAFLVILFTAYSLSSIECFCVLTAWNQNKTLISVLLRVFN